MKFNLSGMDLSDLSLPAKVVVILLLSVANFVVDIFYYGLVALAILRLFSLIYGSP